MRGWVSCLNRLSQSFVSGGSTETKLSKCLRCRQELARKGLRTIYIWESLALLQGSFGPFGPKVANRVRKWVPGPSRPGGPKSAKRSRKRVKIDCFSTILTLFRLCFGLFGPRGGRAQEPIFELYLELSARKARSTPVAGKSFRKSTLRYNLHPNAVVLNAARRRNTLMSAKGRR